MSEIVFSGRKGNQFLGFNVTAPTRRQGDVSQSVTYQIKERVGKVQNSATLPRKLNHFLGVKPTIDWKTFCFSIQIANSMSSSPRVESSRKAFCGPSVAAEFFSVVWIRHCLCCWKLYHGIHTYRRSRKQLCVQASSGLLVFSCEFQTRLKCSFKQMKITRTTNTGTSARLQLLRCVALNYERPRSSAPYASTNGVISVRAFSSFVKSRSCPSQLISHEAAD